MPTFLCITANDNGNIKRHIYHCSGNLSCRYCIAEAEQRWVSCITDAELCRANCHTRVRHRRYIIVMLDEPDPVSIAAKVSTLVFAPTIRRAKAKGSVVSELIAYLI